MPATPDRKHLLATADVYLRDAGQREQSPHGRYSCAMNALGSLCVAGVGSNADQARVDIWEAERYDPEKWPTLAQVDELIAYVTQLRGKAGPSSASS